VFHLSPLTWWVAYLSLSLSLPLSVSLFLRHSIMYRACTYSHRAIQSTRLRHISSGSKRTKQLALISIARDKYWTAELYWPGAIIFCFHLTMQVYPGARSRHKKRAFSSLSHRARTARPFRLLFDIICRLRGKCRPRPVVPTWPLRTILELLIIADIYRRDKHRRIVALLTGY